MPAKSHPSPGGPGSGSHVLAWAGFTVGRLSVRYSGGSLPDPYAQYKGGNLVPHEAFGSFWYQNSRPATGVTSTLTPPFRQRTFRCAQGQEFAFGPCLLLVSKQLPDC